MIMLEERLRNIIRLGAIPVVAIGLSLGCAGKIDDSTPQKALNSAYRAIMKRDIEGFCELTGRDTIKRTRFVESLFTKQKNSKSKYGNNKFEDYFGSRIGGESFEDCYPLITYEGKMFEVDDEKYTHIIDVGVTIYKKEGNELVNRFQTKAGLTKDGGWEIHL